MGILDIAMIIFILMESSNIVILYFFPTFKYGNSLSVFDSYVDSKENESIHLFIKYMKNWVANVKLIFILLLLVVVMFGTEKIKVFSTIAMIISIFIYYVSLHPIIKKLDSLGKISPKCYSRTLFLTITFFVILFSLALIIHFILK